MTKDARYINYRALGELTHSNFGYLTATIFRDRTIADGIRDRILKNFGKQK